MDIIGKVHVKGCIHRDLKPGNIMYNSNGEWKIGDWGLSKRVMGDDGNTKGFKGTLAYSAPEQFKKGISEKIDHQTDIYQIGAITYRLLVGRVPFRGSPENIINKILTERPINPNIIQPKIPKNINNAIMKALEKKKKDRWGYANEFKNALILK